MEMEEWEEISFEGNLFRLRKRQGGGCVPGRGSGQTAGRAGGGPYGKGSEATWGLHCVLYALGYSVLTVPSMHRGIPVVSFEVPEGEQIRMARILSIPETIRELILWNGAFPDLEEIKISEKSFFSTDGRSIFSDGKRDGSKRDYLKVLFGSVDEYFSRSYREEPYLRLLYALRAGEEEELKLSPRVRSLARGALKGTRCIRILCERENLVIEPGALEGTAWAGQNQVLCTQNSLVYVSSPDRELSLPAGVVKIAGQAFADHVPDTLVMDALVLPQGRQLPGGLNEVRVLRLRRGDLLRDPFAYASLTCLERLEISPEDGAARRPEGGGPAWAGRGTRYSSEDGICFEEPGATLVFCPRGREEEILLVPSGTRRIGEKAFAGCKGIRKAVLPEGLKSIGEEAFQGSSLSDIVLPESLEEIGKHAFQDTALKRIELPASLREVGEGALEGVEELAACSGSARGLIASLSRYYDMSGLPCRIWLKVRKAPGPGGLSGGEGTEEVFLLPRYLSLPGRRALKDAWDFGCLSDYEKASGYATMEEERLAMELCALLYRRAKGERGEGKSLEQQHGPMAMLTVGELLIREDQFLLFRGLLLTGTPSSATLQGLLELCNRYGRHTYIPYILNAGGSGGEDFSL